MLAALAGLGRVTPAQTKTTILLAPRKGISWRNIRAAIRANLNPMIGNAFYANLRTQKAFECGSKTGHLWKKVG
jgi:hypothetical protein